MLVSSFSVGGLRTVEFQLSGRSQELGGLALRFYVKDPMILDPCSGSKGVEFRKLGHSKDPSVLPIRVPVGNIPTWASIKDFDVDKLPLPSGSRRLREAPLGLQVDQGPFLGVRVIRVIQ